MAWQAQYHRASELVYTCEARDLNGDDGGERVTTHPHTAGDNDAGTMPGAL